jgi:hypothetical protein
MGIIVSIPIPPWHDTNRTRIQRNESPQVDARLGQLLPNFLEGRHVDRWQKVSGCFNWESPVASVGFWLRLIASNLGIFFTANVLGEFETLRSEYVAAQEAWTTCKSFRVTVSVWPVVRMSNILSVATTSIMMYIHIHVSSNIYIYSIYMYIYIIYIYNIHI